MHPGTPDEREELRSEIGRAVGWLPTDTLHAREHEIRKMQCEAERSLKDANDYASPEAVDLVGAIVEVDDRLAGLEKSPLLKLLTRLSVK